MKNGTEMRRIGFEKNINDSIGVNPPRTTIRIIPQITRTRQGMLGIFDYVRRMPYLAYRSVPWYGLAKSES